MDTTPPIVLASDVFQTLYIVALERELSLLRAAMEQGEQTRRLAAALTMAGLDPLGQYTFNPRSCSVSRLDVE